MSRYELQPMPWDSTQIARLKALFAEVEQANLARIVGLESEVAELRGQLAQLQRELDARREWLAIVSRGAVDHVFPTWH